MTGPVFKQLDAVIDNRTTVICLHAAGQIQPVESPYDTLAGQFDEPPFHVHCRSVSVPYLPGMLEAIRAKANAELLVRPARERAVADGRVPNRIPGPAVQAAKAVSQAPMKEVRGEQAWRAVPDVAVSAEQKAALKSYVESGYRVVNELLRDAKTVEKLRGPGYETPTLRRLRRDLVASRELYKDDPSVLASIDRQIEGAVARSAADVAETLRMVDALDSALTGTRAEAPLVVWRGMTTPRGLKKGKELVGQEFTDAAFVSTSTKDTVAARFSAVLIEVHVPVGKAVVRPAELAGKSVLSEREREILLPRNSVFRVVGEKTKKTSYGQKRVIVVEVV